MVVGRCTASGKTLRYELVTICKGKCTGCGKQLLEEEDGIFLCMNCQEKQKGEKDVCPDGDSESGERER